VGVVVATLLLTASLFSMAGLINAVFAKTFDDISVIPTFVLTPLTYLGGVFYSLSLLPSFWQQVSQVNPIVYMVSGFRYGFLGVTDVSLVSSFTILVAFNILLYVVVHYLLATGKGIRG
jgi:ABC-2 type transport system permease protein